MYWPWMLTSTHRKMMDLNAARFHGGLSDLRHSLRLADERNKELVQEVAEGQKKLHLLRASFLRRSLAVREQAEVIQGALYELSDHRFTSEDVE